jgi:uracil-DNA glycosylase family 4
MIVPTTGPVTANIMLLGEAPGETEDRVGLPFQGPAGRTLNTLLNQAGIIRSQCLIANVARERPPSNKIEHYFLDKKCTIPKPRMIEWIGQLKKEIESYRPNIVIALGATALWALTGLKGIKAYRGSTIESTLVPGQKVLPTYHPQAVGYDWSLAYIVVLDLKKALYHSTFPGVPEDKRTFIIDPPKNEFIELCKRIIEENRPTAVDIEAWGHVNRIGFSNSKYWGFSLGILSGKVPRFPERDEIELWEWIGRILESVPIIYHNASYDMSLLYKNNGIVTNNLYMDTLVASHVLWPELPKSLDFVASICLDVPAWKPLYNKDQGIYNVLDAINTKSIATILEQQLKKNLLWETFLRELSWIEPASMLQLQGLKVDLSLKDKLIEEANKKLDEVDQRLFDLVGEKVNYNSPKQVGELLYIKLGLPVQFKRRKSIKDKQKITTGEDALKKLANQHEVPALIIERRKASKLISTFLDITTSPEGKVHSSYNVAGTSLGGRWSSGSSIIDPYGPGNLQNIPELARQLYTVPKGYKLIGADYVQAEAVVVAYLCLDTVLIQMFKDSFGMSPSERSKEHDIHKHTAAQLYQIPMSEVTKAQRRIGKTLRHGCSYKAGPAVVADLLNITMQQARPLLKLYFEKNHLLTAWHLRIEQQLRSDRSLTNLFGRKHRFLDRWGDSLFRKAYAFIPQSSIGELLNISLTEFYHKYGDDFMLYTQLHDALYVVAREDEVMDLMKILREVMIKEVSVGMETMKVDVDFKVGDSWGTMKEMDISWK